MKDRGEIEAILRDRAARIAVSDQDYSEVVSFFAAAGAYYSAEVEFASGRAVRLRCDDHGRPVRRPAQSQ